MIADFDTLVAAEREQADAMKEIEESCDSVASAIVLVKIMKERIEALEMRLTAEHLKKKCSAAAAKINALASPEYRDGMEEIVDDTITAQSIMQRNNVLHEKLASAREVMANQRKMIGIS